MLHLASNMRQLGHLARGVYGGPFGGHATLGTGLVSYWKMDEASGTTMVDSHTSGYDGTIIGATVNKTGKIGKSYFFDGSNDYVDLGRRNDLKDLSISAWIYLSGLNARHDILNQARTISTRENGYALLVGSDNKLQFHIGVGNVTSSSWVTVLRSDVLSASTWYHVVVTFDEANTYLYVDNDAESTATAHVLYYSDLTTQTQKLGADILGSNLFYGYIDEVGVWSKALTSTEVASLWNGGSGLTY